MTDRLLFHNFHPPGEVRVFTVPVGSIRRMDGDALVYDVRIGDRVLRHYSFARRWFEVNCTLDLNGQFVTEPGPVDWCFNCDISTPHLVTGLNAYNVDLSLDVLVGPDGREHEVIDEDDFAVACSSGWLTPAEQAGARAGLADLLSIIQGEGMVAFLDGVCPFGNVGQTEHQPPMVRKPPAEVAQLWPGKRTWY